MDKIVKGGTKVKVAPPKAKYVEPILQTTNSGEAGVAEVFRTLSNRLSDSTWTVAFKSLIIVHLMIKEGRPDVTLSYLAASPKSRLAINSFTDVQTQGHNIRRYCDYLVARAEAYAATRCDWVRAGDGRIKTLSVDKGLLRETGIIQNQIRALVQCDLLSNDVENEITLTAFRLLTSDLLDLYNVENAAVMNVLSKYFEMSRPDAERAIRIYKTFCKQTDAVVQFLGVARQYEHATRLEIPKIKHAPTSLAKSLQDYLDDKDFEINRRQYLAEQEAKRTGKPISKPTPAASKTSNTTPTTSSQPTASAAPSAPPAAKGPAPDLIDFFESIEQNQQPMAQNVPQFQLQPTGFPAQGQPSGYAVQPQQTGFAIQQQQQTQQQPFGIPQQQQQSFGIPQQPQATGVNGLASPLDSSNPFGQLPSQHQSPQPLQTNFYGAGFGIYGSPQQQQTPPFPSQNAFSPIQTQSPTQVPQQQILQPQMTGSTNPFRQSMMPTGATGSNFSQAQQVQPLQRSATNPFAKSSSSLGGSSGGTLGQIPEQGTLPPQNASFPPPSQPQQQQTLQPQVTGTNPFARNVTGGAFASQQPPQSQGLQPLQVQATGSTNPFRQSAFVNPQTGAGWQNAPQQATMGGLENLETIPIFPRPGVQPPQVQQQTSPWA